MDILIYVLGATFLGIINCARNGNLNFEEIALEDLQQDIGDESLGTVIRDTIAIKDGNGYDWDKHAFTKIGEELGV